MLSSSTTLKGVKGERWTASRVDAQRAAAAGGCSICTADIGWGESVLELHCKHIFHATCLETWLNKQPTCPLCRVEAVDITEIVNGICADMHAVMVEQRHHHELVPPLERLNTLAQDDRFIDACSGSCGIILRAGRSSRCPQVRGLALDLVLHFTQRNDIHCVLDDHREALFDILEESLQDEHPHLRAVCCGIVWNLAIPGPHAQDLRTALNRFLDRILGLIEDTEALVANRAANALWYLVQSPERVNLVLNHERISPLVLHVSRLDSNREDLRILLQTLAFVLETGNLRPESRLHCWLQNQVLTKLPEWLQNSHHTARIGALTCAVLLSNSNSEEHIPRWHSFYDYGGPLHALLCTSPESIQVIALDGTVIAPAAETSQMIEARAHSIGIIWNLALNARWRQPLADRVLDGLLGVAREGERLDSVSRARLVTALAHLSKDRTVASSSAWPEMITMLCRQVQLSDGETFGQGLTLLDGLLDAHGCTLAKTLMEWLWQFVSLRAMGPEKPEIERAFHLFLKLSMAHTATDWLWEHDLKQDENMAMESEAAVWLREDPAEVLASTLCKLSGSVPVPSSESLSNLCGALWNLAMDDKFGRRQALGKAILPLVPRILRTHSGVCIERLCTAVCHLSKCIENATLIRYIGAELVEGRGSGIEVAAVSALESLHHPQHRFDNAIGNIFEFLRRAADVTDDKSYAFHVRIGSSLLEYFERVNFFAHYLDTPGNICSSVFRLLWALSGNPAVCELFLAASICHPAGVVQKFLVPDVQEEMARSHIIGIVLNIARLNNDVIKAQIADIALEPLLELAGAVVNETYRETHHWDCVMVDRLQTALFFLSVDVHVATRPAWIDKIEMLCKLTYIDLCRHHTNLDCCCNNAPCCMRERQDKWWNRCVHILHNLIAVHGAQQTLQAVWRVLPDPEDAQPLVAEEFTFELFYRLSILPGSADRIRRQADLAVHLEAVLHRLRSRHRCHQGVSFLLQAICQLASPSLQTPVTKRGSCHNGEDVQPATSNNEAETELCDKAAVADVVAEAGSQSFVPHIASCLVDLLVIHSQDDGGAFESISGSPVDASDSNIFILVLHAVHHLSNYPSVIDAINSNKIASAVLVKLAGTDQSNVTADASGSTTQVILKARELLCKVDGKW